MIWQHKWTLLVNWTLHSPVYRQHTVLETGSYWKEKSENCPKCNAFQNGTNQYFYMKKWLKDYTQYERSHLLWQLSHDCTSPQSVFTSLSSLFCYFMAHNFTVWVQSRHSCQSCIQQISTVKALINAFYAFRCWRCAAEHSGTAKCIKMDNTSAFLPTFQKCSRCDAHQWIVMWNPLFIASNNELKPNWSEKWALELTSGS